MANKVHGLWNEFSDVPSLEGLDVRLDAVLVPHLLHRRVCCSGLPQPPDSADQQEMDFHNPVAVFKMPSMPVFHIFQLHPSGCLLSHPERNGHAFPSRDQLHRRKVAQHHRSLHLNDGRASLRCSLVPCGLDPLREEEQNKSGYETYLADRRRQNQDVVSGVKPG